MRSLDLRWRIAAVDGMAIGDVRGKNQEEGGGKGNIEPKRSIVLQRSTLRAGATNNEPRPPVQSGHHRNHI